MLLLETAFGCEVNEAMMKMLLNIPWLSSAKVSFIINLNILNTPFIRSVGTCSHFRSTLCLDMLYVVRFLGAISGARSEKRYEQDNVYECNAPVPRG